MGLGETPALRLCISGNDLGISGFAGTPIGHGAKVVAAAADGTAVAADHLRWGLLVGQRPARARARPGPLRTKAFLRAQAMRFEG